MKWSEKLLISVWTDTFGVGGLNCQANFYDLGGTSLAAVTIITRLTERLGKIKLCLLDILDNPTIEELANVIEERASSFAGQRIPRCSQKERDFPSLGQEVFLAKELVSRTSSDYRQYQVSLALELKGTIDTTLLQTSLNAIVQRHDVLRTSYWPVLTAGPIELEGWSQVRDGLRRLRVLDQCKIGFRSRVEESARVEVDLFNVDCSNSGGLRDSALALAESSQRRFFDYDAPPLLRAAVLTTGMNYHVLIVVLSHLVSDGWSLNVLSRELAHFYANEHAIDLGVLPDLPVQFADFAAWQRKQVERSSARASRSTSRVPLHASEVTATNFNKDLSHRQIGSIDSLWEVQLCGRLRAFAQDHNITVFMLLYASFNVLLYLLSGKNRIITLTIFANRPPEVTNLIGWFAATHAVCVEFTHETTIADVFEQLRSEFSRAIASEELPAELTPAELNFPKPGHSFLFELRSPILTHDFPGATVKTIDLFRPHDSFTALHVVVEELPSNSGIRVGLRYCRDCCADESFGASKVLEALRNVTLQLVTSDVRGKTSVLSVA